MPAVVTLQGAENLVVQPGQTTTCQLSLANTGSIVEQFTIMALGDAVTWIHPEPPVVSLFPGAQQTVTLTFSPPRDHAIASGVVHFGVKVIPSNEPDESVTEEGAITVGAFNDIGAELVPRVVSGRIGGRQRLAVDSRGNSPLPVEISAIDAASALKFQLRPAVLTTAPGAAHFVRIRIRPRQRFWRGVPQQKPYQIHVVAESERPLVLDGAYTQKAVLPKWLLPLLVVLAALALLWFLVFRPAIHNEAVSANRAALAAQAAKTNALAAKTAQNSAASAANAASIASLSGKPAPTTTSTSTTTTTVPKKVTASAATTATTTTTTLPPPVTEPTEGELQVISAPGATATDATPQVGTGSTLTVTDIVIQNISGSSGTARIERVVPGQPTQDLLIENLGTLTDQEYTLNTPLVFSHEQQLQLEVDCNGDQTACNVSILYTGPITEPQSATTTTIP